MDRAATDPLHQELVMLVRAGLTRSEALDMTRVERHAWITEYNRQEEAAYRAASASTTPPAPPAPGTPTR